MAPLILLAAVAQDRVIGIRNTLPWHLPEDLQRFKALTTGHRVLMGRKTYDSIVARLGKPLPNRRSIVLTRDSSWQPSVPPGADVRVIHSVEALDRQEPDSIYVIGGAEVYAQTMSIATELDITEVELSVEGDAFFPEIDPRVWLRDAGHDNRSEASGIAYRFVHYRRRSAGPT